MILIIQVFTRRMVLLQLFCNCAQFPQQQNFRVWVCVCMCACFCACARCSLKLRGAGSQVRQVKVCCGSTADLWTRPDRRWGRGSGAAPSGGCFCFLLLGPPPGLCPRTWETHTGQRSGHSEENYSDNGSGGDVAEDQYQTGLALWMVVLMRGFT